MAILSLHKRDELVRLVGVVGITFETVECHTHSLRAYYLACRGYERHKSGIAAHLRNELHSIVEHLLSLQLAKLCHHVAVHSTRNLGKLHNQVRLRETEIVLNCVASIEQCLLVVSLRILNGLVEERIYLGRKCILQRVEVVGEVLHEVEVVKLLAYFLQLCANLAHSLHVCLHFHSELLAEHIDKLKCRCSRAATEIPYISVENIHSVDNRHQRRSKSVARRTVCVEIHRHTHSLFQLRHKRCKARRVHKSGHILQRDNLGTHCLKALGFLHEIFIGENQFLFLQAAKQAMQEASCALLLEWLRIDSVAHRSIGYSTQAVDNLYRLTHVVKVVERIKNTHHVQSVLDCLLIEALYHLSRIRHIAKKIATTRQCSQERLALNLLACCAQAVPRALTKIAHYRVGNCATPHLYCIESCLLVVGQQLVDAFLRHTGCKQRLLTITHGQISDFQFLNHILPVLNLNRLLSLTTILPLALWACLSTAQYS